MPDLYELRDYCDALLSVSEFEDYCPNGLQVEAGTEVSRVLTGVTASLALVEAAAQVGCDLLLVHHGYFWKGEDPRIVGFKARRIAGLLRHGISLMAYHLPLDGHPELGNNRQLGLRLGLPGGGQPVPGGGLLWWADLDDPLDGAVLAERLGRRLDRDVLRVSGAQRKIRRLVWCTGGAQGFIEAAAAFGADAYLSGEISEQTTHLARELGIDYFAAGHHASERYGVQALGEHLARHFGIEHQFVEVPNPA